MTSKQLQKRITEVRQFNRFYTRIIGVLREGLLHSPFSLTEARILFEIAHKNNLTASDLRKILGLDPGYLSRILNKLEQEGLVNKIKSDKDGRRRLLNLTVKGKESFEILNSRSSEEIGEMLNGLTETDQIHLLKSMHEIESILDKGLKFSEPFFIRTHEPGDLGWVTHRHGELYFHEYDWDQTFEALVSQIVADFIKNYNPDRERCWIAEMNGEKVGSVFLVQHTDEIAKLRLLLVEPKARGLGLGTRLVEECIRFARCCRYKKIVLWTNNVLLEARHIYQKTGFTLVKQEEHHSFGHDLIGENWELIL